VRTTACLKDDTEVRVIERGLPCHLRLGVPGALIAAGMGKLKGWKLEWAGRKLLPKVQVDSPRGLIQAMTMDPDNGIVVTGHADGAVAAWSLSSGSSLWCDVPSRSGSMGHPSRVEVQGGPWGLAGVMVLRSAVLGQVHKVPSRKGTAESGLSEGSGPKSSDSPNDEILEGSDKESAAAAGA